MKTVAEEFGEEKARAVIEAAMRWTRPTSAWPALDASEEALMDAVSKLWTSDRALTENERNWTPECESNTAPSPS